MNEKGSRRVEEKKRGSGSSNSCGGSCSSNSTWSGEETDGAFEAEEVAAENGNPSGEYCPPVISVTVTGLNFEYQFTEGDLRKVFARYGMVKHVQINETRSSANVMLQ